MLVGMSSPFSPAVENLFIHAMVRKTDIKNKTCEAQNMVQISGHISTCTSQIFI